MARDSVTIDLLIKWVSYMDHGYNNMEIAEMSDNNYTTICRYLNAVTTIRDGKAFTPTLIKSVNGDVITRWANKNGLKVKYEQDKPKQEEKPQQMSMMSYNTQAQMMETLMNIKTLLLSIESSQKETLTILKKYLEV